MKSFWNAAVPHIQAIFCHDSLGTKIKINKIGDLIYMENDDNFASKAKEIIGDGHLLALMSGDTSCGGEAWGKACKKFPKAPGRSKNCYHSFKTNAYFARVS